MMLAMMLTALVATAKDIKTVVLTTTPQMHCENCENKIKGNLKFEKGVKDIVTDVKQQTVTVKYDADTTTPDKIAAAFGKFGYSAKTVEKPQDSCCNEKKQDGCNTEKKGCCAKKAGCQSQNGCRQACKKADGNCPKKKEGCPETKQGGCCSEK